MSMRLPCQATQGIRFPPDAAQGSEKVANRLTASDVAKNVLNFVEDRLARAVASGATPERLSNLLKQARSGIDQGA